jgi:hypothetical protein
LAVAAALQILPKHIRSRSFSQREIVLDFEDALEAIQLLKQKGWAIISWEGWLSFPDGRVGHSDQFQGTVELLPFSDESWAKYVQRAAEHARATILKSAHDWDRTQKDAGSKLLYCLTAWSKGEARQARS